MERIQLPLAPSGPSLAAHIAALDLLAARLDALPTRSRWPARIPINSKASFDGDIIHTDEIKVNIGGDWWIEMRATEAADYVRRRKAALLQEHARMTEGKDRAPEVPAPVPQPGQRAFKTSQIKFDLLLAHPIRSAAKEGSARAAAAPAAPGSSQAEASAPQAGDIEMSDASSSQGVEKKALPDSLQHLLDLVGTQMKDKLHLPKGEEGSNDNSTVNEEGLPIHEIREAVDGTLLTPMPQGTGEGAVTIEDKDDDYWSPEAVSRRAKLRQKIFHEGSSDETDDEEEAGEDGDVEMQDAASGPSVLVQPATPAIPSSKEGQWAFASDNAGLHPDDDRATTPPLSGAMVEPPSPSTSVRSAASARSATAPPKSILKLPKRKKSVSFDASVPLPPDSPPIRQPRLPSFGAAAFPLEESTPGAAKPVPILNAPMPGRQSQRSAASPFAGFKPGFLSSAHGTSPAPAKIVEIPPDEPAFGPAAAPIEVDEPAPPTAPAPKKQSLFAQRRADAAAKVSPQFPKLSESKPMATMKNAVQETAPPPAGLSAPPAVGSMPPSVGSALGGQPRQPVVVVDDDDEDDDDYGDLGDFSDDEEDEYNLDEALLAREVALEYHRRQQWQRPIDEDEFDPEAPEHEGGLRGGVLMGIPRVSTITGGDSEEKPLRILNPTADDLGQFLRVGRADDGELVFERPNVGADTDSDSDGEADDAVAKDRRERRARRQDVMNRLLAGNYEDDQPSSEQVSAAEQQRRDDFEREFELSLPPSVTSAPASAPAPPTSAALAPQPRAPAVRPEGRDVVERLPPPTSSSGAAPEAASPEPPKKISRFKAARAARS